MIKHSSLKELPIPPAAKLSPKAAEVLRVWTAPGEKQQVTLTITWQDPAAWGLMLADIARHAANAYANEGHDRATVLRTIRKYLDAEFSNPTDEPVQLN